VSLPLEPQSDVSVNRTRPLAAYKGKE
jgi:hypothetical protein